MQTTANYGFKKPDGVETVNIDDLNYNADVADVELKKRALQTDFSSHLADNTAHGIGDKTKLSTTAKDTIVAAINEVFQSGTNVKSSTISAVNNKGQSLSTTATWDKIIAAINSIARGQGNAVESQVLSGADFSNSDGILRHGSMPNNGTVVLTPTTVNQAIAQGYHPGTGYVKGDANLVTSNIKSGVSIFGVSGKSSVVETTESVNPIAASTVRSGKVGYVNGSKITGSLAVQATSAQTITPGTSDQIKDAGIYDGAVTIKGDSNLQSSNILKGKSIFGIMGTLEEKLDFDDYLCNLPSNVYFSVGYIKGEGLYAYNIYNPNKTLYLFDSSGNIIRTITNPSTNNTIFPSYVNKNYILWCGINGNYHATLTDKNGTIIKEIIEYSSSYYMGGCMIGDKICLVVSTYPSGRVTNYDLNGNLLFSHTIVEFNMLFFCIPMQKGVLVSGKYNYDYLYYIPMDSTKSPNCLYNGTSYAGNTILLFAQLFNGCF